MPSPAATLSKEERLHGKKDIADLLARGKWGSAGNLRCCISPNGLEFSRILVSVPKKCFKRAVKRNLLKRRIREAYRLQKGLLAGSGNDGALASGADILFQYSSREVASFAAVKADVAAVLQKAGGVAAKVAGDGGPDCAVPQKVAGDGGRVVK